MKKVKRFLMLTSAVLLLLTAGCASKQVDENGDSVHQKDKKGTPIEVIDSSENTEEEPEEVIEEIKILTDADIDTIEWQPIQHIDDLTGVWNSSAGTYIYPFELNGKAYLKYQWIPTRDDELWQKEAKAQQTTIRRLWVKKYSVLSSIYGLSLPVADSNETEFGIHVKAQFKDEYTATIISRYEILIPETIVDKNLRFFMFSEDKEYMRETGIFRYYSNQFQNRKAEEVLYHKEELPATYDEKIYSLEELGLVPETVIETTEPELPEVDISELSAFEIAAMEYNSNGIYLDDVTDVVEEFNYSMDDEIVAVDDFSEFTDINDLNKPVEPNLQVVELPEIDYSKLPERTIATNLPVTAPAKSSQYPKEEIGLVLSGGGGKGAYEVGVWKAFEEYGIKQKITAISGTSVGGLNSALFALVDIPTVESIWINKVPDKLTQNDSLISQEGLTEIIDSIPLTNLQGMAIPEVTVTATRNRFLLPKLLKSKPTQYASRFILNNEFDATQLKNKLLATSAFPVICSPIKLADGYEYSDGGNEAVGGDNTPIDPVAKHDEIKKIFIVYLAAQPKRLIKPIDYDKKELVQIIPSIELGGILDGTANFNADRIQLLIKYGYDDAVKILRQNGYFPVTGEYWFD